MPRRPSQAVFSYVLAVIPFAVGSSLFGFTFGMLAQGVGLSYPQSAAMSAFIFSGVAQITALGMVEQNAALPMLFLVTFLLSLRFLLMTLSLAPYMQGFPLWQRILGSAMLTDTVFALTIERFWSGRTDHRFLFTANLTFFVCYMTGTTLGFFAGETLAALDHLRVDIIFPLLFTALLASILRQHRDLGSGCLGASVAAVLAVFLEPRLVAGTSVFLGACAGWGVTLLYRQVRPPSDAKSIGKGEDTP